MIKPDINYLTEPWEPGWRYDNPIVVQPKDVLHLVKKIDDMYRDKIFTYPLAREQDYRTAKFVLDKALKIISEWFKAGDFHPELRSRNYKIIVEEENEEV